jgi:coenzyme F420-reducing hydrogenase alpha subunit
VSELREILAIGERVEVHGTRVTLVLAADGAERLGANALADFVRDW